MPIASDAPIGVLGAGTMGSGIAHVAAAAGHAVDRHELNLPEGAIRTLGSFPLDVNLHADLTVQVTVEVTAE